MTVQNIQNGIGHLFGSHDEAANWWQDTLCHMYTTARQLWHEEDDAVALLYGGQPTAVDTSRTVAGVVPRLERRLADGWRPESMSALDGFLWSRLRYEYKSLLCLRSGISRWQPLSEEILNVVCDPEADGAEMVQRSHVLAEERQARAEQLQAVRAALERNPKLGELLGAVVEVVAASEDADEDVTAEGWRKAVLQRTGQRLGVSQSTLHQRLKRIRDVWEQVVRQ